MFLGCFLCDGRTHGLVSRDEKISQDSQYLVAICVIEWVMRNVLAANMGFSLFADRQRWRLRTVRAAGIRRFITSDQPVMNLLEPVGHNDLALYYPLGPTVAALMEHLDNPGVVGEQTELDDDAVRMLNRRIFAFSHEQVIGTHPDEFADLEEADWASAALSGLLTFGEVRRQIASREPLETDHG